MRSRRWRTAMSHSSAITSRSSWPPCRSSRPCSSNSSKNGESRVAQIKQAWRGSIWTKELLFDSPFQTEQRNAGQPGQDVHGKQQSHQPGQEHKKQGRAREVHPAESVCKQSCFVIDLGTCQTKRVRFSLFRRVRELNSSNTKKFLDERKRVGCHLFIQVYLNSGSIHVYVSLFDNSFFQFFSWVMPYLCSQMQVWVAIKVI